jgi:hypothetical protein
MYGAQPSEGKPLAERYWGSASKYGVAGSGGNSGPARFYLDGFLCAMSSSI